jgi:subfamily B ATP-binding cassette protein MsbA
MPALLKPLLDSGFTDGTLSLWMVPVAIIGVFLIRGLAQFVGQYALAALPMTACCACAKCCSSACWRPT